MAQMRATLIGRFLLLSILGLVILVPLWYIVSPTLARPPTWLAGAAMKALFPWVKDYEMQGVQSVLHTMVQVRTRGPSGDVLREMSAKANYPILGYGIALLWAMLLAARTPRWWLKGLVGTLILIVSQAMGLCFYWLRDVVVFSGPMGSEYLGYSRFTANAILYGFQFWVLMMTPMLPILLWLLFNRPFVAALWLEAALEGPGQEQPAAPPVTQASHPPGTPGT